MTKRGVGLAVGGGLIAAGLAVTTTAVFVAPFALFFGYPLAIAGGLILGKTLRIGERSQP
ncbi:hypothetical protein E1258_13425 [Micromonospora sp. KC207]|uniref:hypothetical protein n=1 Tax=Micromonospora sp. KC207 TaxID=2530377 RepID=UPI001044A318|nr:hypothetical protein [Micromonospora sp. KC207]TDC60865.1 hypothetical protein E1258_13425 [Micromonospora sp. KC207]